MIIASAVISTGQQNPTDRGHGSPDAKGVPGERNGRMLLAVATRHYDNGPAGTLNVVCETERG